ncbi:ionotropic receptor 25a isoform X2 [Cimex lectularius]|nr:ionotropic receptor 25a isoform X2 [Cimex lectularius]
MESNLRVALFSGLNTTTANQMKKMRPTPPFNVIVGETKFIKASLEKAHKFQLVRRDNTWILVFTDFKYGEMERDFYEKDTDVLTWNPTACCTGSEKNCECPLEMDFSDEFLGQVKIALETAVSKSLSQGVLERAISINCDASNDNINSTSVFSNQLLKAAHEHWALFYDAENSILTPNLNLNFQTESKKGNLNLASWSRSTGLIKEKHIKPVKRFFRIGTGYSIPFAYPAFNDKNEKIIGPDGNQVWEGYCIDLIERLAKDMNFDFELVTSYDFGEKKMDGSWTGLIGELQRGQIDIIVGTIIMTSEREEVIDFVAPYFEQTGLSIMIRKPLRKTSLFKFMTVLRVEVWFSILGALCLTAVMIWFLDKYSPYSARNNKEKYPYPCRIFSLRESFWFAITSFTPQGGGEAPKALSARTLVAAYWLFVVLMLATFTANLAAFLTVERMQSPVQSLKQLSKQSRINYTVVTDSEAHAYFRNMKNAEETLYNVWKEITLNRSVDQSKYRVWDYPIKEQYGRILIAIEKTGTVASMEEGFNKVKENENAEFALIHDALRIKYEVYSDCNLTEIGEPFAEQPYAIAVQQGSHLNEEISRRIIDLQRDRYFESLSAKYWNTTKKGKCDSSDEDEGITLESLGGVFIATLFGLFLAMLTLAAEVYYQKKKTKGKIADKGDFKRTMFRDENFAKKEFNNTFKKRSNLVNSKSKVNFIKVYPRDQLF